MYNPNMFLLRCPYPCMTCSQKARVLESRVGSKGIGRSNLLRPALTPREQREFQRSEEQNEIRYNPCPKHNCLKCGVQRLCGQLYLEIGNGSCNLRGKKSLCRVRAGRQPLFALAGEMTRGHFPSPRFKLMAFSLLQ